MTFDRTDFVTLGMRGDNISQAAHLCYWLGSHGIDVSFHEAEIESQYALLTGLVEAMRAARKPALEVAA